MEDWGLGTDNLKPTSDSIPTIEETHKAQRVYLEGMKHYYPGVDPRMSLLGMKDSPSYEYKTEAYGNSLIRTPTKLQHIKDKIKNAIVFGFVFSIVIQLLDYVF